MSNANFTPFIIGIAVLAAGCEQRPSGNQLRVKQNTTQAELDQPRPGDDEVARALVEFEKGTASDSIALSRERSHREIARGTRLHPTEL